MAINSFIFGGDTGETPDSIKRKRALAYALIQAQNTPRNVGEGIDALGKGLVAGILGRRADKAETAGVAKSNSAFDALINGGSSAPSTVPMSGTGNEVSASSPAPSGPVTAKGEIADYIRQAAAARGIDPDVALRVAMSEGGLENPVNQSSYVKNGVREQSYGPFQLYMGGGLGNKALEAGIDPRDPNQWQKGVDFALDQAKQGGWGPWYGAKKIGVTGMAGIGNAPTQVAAAQPTTATDAIAAQSPTPPPVSPQQAYVDPQVTNVGPQQPMPNAAAALAAPQGRAMAPQLPPPQNVSAPPPVAAVPQQAPQQVAQSTPAQALSRGPSIQQLMQVAQDPYLDEGKRSVVNALLQQKLKAQQDEQERIAKQSDPAYQTDLQLKQAQLDNIRNPKPPSEVQALNARAEAAGLRPGTKEYQDFMISGGKGPLVTVNNGNNSSKFSEESDKAAAARLGSIEEAGNAAPQMMGDLQQLSELGKQIGTGKGAQVMTAIGPYAQALGVDVKGLDEAQAFTAIVNRIAPQMRPAGAGATSDFDAKQFLSSLPSLGNQPGGNELISQTFQAVQQNKIAAAEIAAKAHLPQEEGGITWQEAEKQIRSLPNPYEVFKANKDKLKATEVPKQQEFQGAPAVGTKEDGYVFKGGDPADPKNWQQEM